MIQNFKDFDRRILTFPAVHPCGGIAPATLLISLINVAQNICGYRSKFFASNKRNAKEAIRQIGTLLMFLEELGDVNSISDLPDSIVFSLSELSLIFQKILYLLEDGTREGARLLMLMNSEFVANRFQVLIRAAATALDILPLHLIDVPIEVKEHVELVMKQARRARFEVDHDDNEAMKEVTLILAQFVDSVTPQEDKMKRVLDHIGITRWSFCNKEVKFLASEIDFQWSSQEKRDVSFLSDLMSFMTYCRCVLFDFVDRGCVRPSDRCRRDMIHCLNPDDFRCPISLDFMIDPVTVATGHTYDRASILKWFRAGNPSCPKTGEKLKNKDLVPNLALRQIIQQYCSQNSIPFPESSNPKRDITRTIFAGSSTAEKITRALANFLAGLLDSGVGEEKSRAAYEIKLLSKASIFNGSSLIETGLILILLKLLRSSDKLTQENAITAVLNLSKHSKSKGIIMNNGGLDAIVYVLKKGLKVEARQLAAGTLFYIASVEEYRKRISENKDAVLALMELLKGRTDCGEKNAMVALYGLLMNPGNHQKVLEAGAVPLLINLLTSDKENLITDSMAVLASLAEWSDGTAAILHCGALSSIMGFLDSCRSRAGKECCVSLLFALCINGGPEVISILVKSNSLMSSLYDIVSEGTSRASKKASSLIRALHEYIEKMLSRSDPIILRLPQDRIVDVFDSNMLTTPVPSPSKKSCIETR